MIVYVETARIKTPGTIQVRVDPHDNRCHGDHDVVIVAVPAPPDGEYYATLTWGASLFLSVAGSREFAAAIIKACDIAEQIKRDGKYIEAE